MVKVHSLAALLAIVCVGCSGSPTPTVPAASTGPATGQKFVAKAEPAGVVGVGAAREFAKTDDEVVLVGRIGGSEKPFVDGVAAFTIVDPKVPYCAADEGCATPWDYCCKQNDVKDNIATVKVVDGSKTVAADAKQLLGVKELTVVVVKGKAKRDESGNLTVLADQVFVKE